MLQILLICILFLLSVFTEAIIEKIKEAGFNISLQRDVELNKELASKLYMEHEGKEFYENLIDHMSRYVF